MSNRHRTRIAFLTIALLLVGIAATVLSSPREDQQSARDGAGAATQPAEDPRERLEVENMRLISDVEAKVDALAALLSRCPATPGVAEAGRALLDASRTIAEGRHAEAEAIVTEAFAAFPAGCLPPAGATPADSSSGGVKVPVAGAGLEPGPFGPGPPILIFSYRPRAD